MDAERAVPETHSRVRSDVHREGKRGETSGQTNNIVPQHALHAQCMHACMRPHTLAPRQQDERREAADVHPSHFVRSCFRGSWKKKRLAIGGSPAAGWRHRLE